MIIPRCFKYRLRPTPTQIETLVQWAGCRRWLWNWALQRKQAHYGATGKSLSYNALAGELVDLKRQPATRWLKDCHSQVLQQVLMDLETAFANFFAKRAKYPRWKSRKATPPSLRFPQNVTVVDGVTISVPKIGLVKAVIHRPLAGVVKGATIKQDATGAWFVVFVCHIDRPEMQPTADHPVGIDVGLESFTTLHTGHKVAPPKFSAGVNGSSNAPNGGCPAPKRAATTAAKPSARSHGCTSASATNALIGCTSRHWRSFVPSIPCALKP